MRVNVIKTSKDKLQQVDYTFYLGWENKLVLDQYLNSSRKTTRHQFRADEIWSRLDKRHNTIDRPCVSPDIIEEAKQKIIDTIIYEEK